MIVVLLTWIALSLVLGVVIGKAIHQADRMAFPACPHRPSVPTSPSTRAPVAVVRSTGEAATIRGLRAA